MQIGQVIRKYRKEKNMTQEEMANRLGVTTPAVNKWENGNSYPDITMLAPIARLLGISLDILLSFQEELSDEEIRDIVLELDERFKKNSYEETFQWTKNMIETYPNCKMLIWQAAVILDAQRMVKDVANSEKYDAYILACYKRVLDSEDETLRTYAADSLFGYYFRKEQYDAAEGYLKYFSEQNPERKRKQAEIYSRTDRTDEAYKAYEELLFSEYGMLSLIFNGIYVLAMQEQDLKKAHMIMDKQEALAKLFEMGKYHEVSCRLELATIQKDVDLVLETMQEMLESIGEVTKSGNSELYKHMRFKESRGEFIEEIKKNLIECFRDEETYGFLKEDKRWQKIVGMISAEE